MRAWKIAFRTAHIAAMALVVGGHAFDAATSRIYPWLLTTIVTGAALVAVEARDVSFRWVFEGRGLMVLAKLALLAIVPFAWSARLQILFVVIVIASVGSHMPGRFRHYSVIERGRPFPQARGR